MGFAGTRNIRLIAGLVAAGALSVDRGMEITVRKEPSHPEPTEPRRAPAPNGGRIYKANGKREVERRLRQMERIAAKRSALTPKGD